MPRGIYDRGQKRQKKAAGMLPQVQQLIEIFGLHEVIRRARKTARMHKMKWYKKDYYAETGFARWEAGATTPETWVLNVYEVLIRNHGEVPPPDAPPEPKPEPEPEPEPEPVQEKELDVIEQVEEALTCTDLPRAMQFWVLMVLAKALEKEEV